MAQRGRPRHPDVLTPREWEVLALLRERLSNEQIADRLGISADGAKYHVSQILSKLGVASREQAAAWRPTEPAPGRWSGSRLAIPIIAATVAVAAIGGLGLLAWGVVSTSGENDPEEEFRSASRFECPLGAECPPSPVWSPTGEYVTEESDAALYVLWFELDTTATVDYAIVSGNRLLAAPAVALTDDNGREYRAIGRASRGAGDGIAFGTATFERPSDDGQGLILRLDYPRDLSVSFAENVDPEHGCCYREAMRIAPEAFATPRGQMLYTVAPCGWSLTVIDGDERVVNQAPFSDCE